VSKNPSHSFPITYTLYQTTRTWIFPQGGFTDLSASSTIGCFPQLKPYAKYLPDPFFSNGMKAVENLAGIAVARVNARLANPKTDRVDLLARLMESRDEKGEKLGREELTAEALTQLIAGSDTTSNTSCALLFHCLRHPEVVAKLQKELDEAIPDIEVVPTFARVKDLP